MGKSWRLSFKDARRWLAAALAMTLVMGTLGGVAQAAEETVTGIELDYEEEDYNTSTSSLEMFVEDDKVNVTVLASISGSASKKDVTADAAWKTSNSSIVKVDKGVLTGVGAGSATITATYKGFTASMKATSDFVYDEVVIMQNNSAAPASIPDVKLGDSLAFMLDGQKGSASGINITSEAVWTSSNTAVATVDEGKITLVGAGTATITAKYKGKSDTVKLTVTSPYKSIEIGPEQPGDLLELEVGADNRVLSATASPKTGGTLTVTELAKWTSANTKVVTVEKGAVTAVGAGKTTITASYLGVTDTISVVVRTPYQSIKLSPEKEYHMQLQDAPLQMQADVLNNANVGSNITASGEWSSSDVSVATVSQGKVTPKGVGTTKITVSHKGISRSIDVTVYPSITKLKAEKTKIDGFKGITAELPKVTATTFDGSTVDVSKLVKWTNEDEDIAKLEGTSWTAKELGETTFTAKAQGLSAEVTLTVHLKPVKLIAETKDMSIVLGKSTELPQVNVIYEDGEEADISESIEWKTTSDNILLLEKSMKGLESSTVTLTGTYLTKTVSVRVKIEEEIVKLTFEPAKIELNPGRSKSIKVYGYYKDGKKISVGTKMNWTVANTNVATVSGSSSVKAIDVGTTKVSGSYQGKTIEITVIVTSKLKSLQLSGKSAQLAIGDSYNVTAQAVYVTGSPVDATTAAVWTSSKESVATVKDGKITAVGKGSATIKAAFGGKTATFRVTVK
ncbi:Ig-like domain-containing protein [Paenibacillus sp. LHD-117]|uniref:Ig-like domain-containing protein n=1 Tax=Paenibacillus sp. LHD-117 TaxID=3071412 RepID=UPI0027E1493C|nr:Ig-like domain-containing protein [Paenibacillus sp. LHD-117]MDQ6420982.1 Ig-like domain-containing protein [Paenibacillus sp. LHD-117]